MLKHLVIHTVIGVGVLSRFFGCAPSIADLRVEAINYVARGQIGGTDSEPKSVEFDRYLRAEISTRTNLAQVENATYPVVRFCGDNNDDEFSAFGPYYHDSELFRSKTTQTGPRTSYTEVWPVKLSPDPSTGRYLYSIYINPVRTLQNSTPYPRHGELRMLPYDIASDRRDLCVTLKMIQIISPPKYSNVAVISRRAITLAYDRSKGLGIGRDKRNAGAGQSGVSGGH